MVDMHDTPAPPSPSALSGGVDIGVDRHDLHPFDSAHRGPTKPDRRSWSRVVVAAVLVGVVFGPADLAGQVHAPYPFANLFNSPAVWAGLAFGFGVWVDDRRRSTVGSIVALLVAVEMYYLADVVLRGADVGNLTSPAAVVWLGLGIGAGLVFGTAGAWTNHPSAWIEAGARGLLPAVFASEAVNQVVQHVTTAPDSGRDDGLQFALLLALLAVGALVWALRGADRLRRTPVSVAAVALTIVGAGAYAVLSA